MPAEITLRFAKIENKDADFDVPVPMTVHYDDSDTESFEFANPLTDKALTELRWYIERYYYWPQGPDYIRAAELEKGLREMGSALFDAVFKKSPDALRLFERMMAHRDDGATLTIDSTEPRILRLPWELIADEGGYLFSKKPQVNVRRRLHKVAKAQQHAFDLPARVLMVISRPDEAGFIDPRSSAEPMLDALDELGDQVIVEFLRPPTLATLTRRLRDPRLPPVHVVHFDGHGVYDKGIGLGFLLFEDDEHKKDLVDAERLGSLLNECGIPLMILDACQSSMPDDRNPFASVAARLIESGVGGVVAMNYSVLVETSKRITKHFYKAMADGQSVSVALDVARLELLMDTKRLTLHRGEDTQTISLQDWFVPVLYQQAIELVPFKPHSVPSAVELRTNSAVETPQVGVSIRDGNTQVGGDITGRDNVRVNIGDVADNANVNVSIKVEDRPSSLVPSAVELRTSGHGQKKRVRVRVGFPTPPQHGFHGRARELLNLERAFADHHIVVLHGYGGQGKTALATHAAQWFTRTGLFERAMFLSFESGAGLEWAINTLGEALVSDDFRSHTDMNKKIAMLSESLATTPTLIVWDNFESIMAKGDVPLPADELKTLLDAGAQWLGLNDGDERGGGDTVRSRLLITTRDVSFESQTYQPSKRCKHIPLSGLESADAMELAAEILTARDVPRPPRESLARLLNFLGGHPLSIQLVLPALRDTPDVEEMIANFETLLPGFTQGAGVERNESLNVSLRFSLRRLGAGAQEALPRLAVFQGGALENNLLSITEIDKDVWAVIKPELANASLIRIEEIDGVTVPYIHFHPTLVPYLRQSDQPSTLSQSPLAIRYWQSYFSFANFLYQTDSQSPLQARALAVREMPNLRRALRMAIEAGAVDEAVDFATRINRFLDNFGRWRERDEVIKEVGSLKLEVESGGITKAEYLRESGRGEVLLQQGRAGEAERVFRALLARLEMGAKDEWGYGRTVTLHWLGRCLKAQGKPSVAAEHYRAALKLAETLEQTKNVHREMSVTHTDLADVLRDMGQYAEAEAEYNLALGIMREIDDDRSVAAILRQLGTLARKQNKPLEARKRYIEAQRFFHQLGETLEEAKGWHLLGSMDLEGGDLESAERNYKEALSLYEAINDYPNRSMTLNQLAIVAKGAGRLDEAERWYMRAIEMDEQLGNPKEIAPDYNNLADLLLAQNRLDEAERYAHKAREIDETLDLSVEPWKDYYILAQIAAKRGKQDEARGWRRKEQETFAAFAGNSQVVEQFSDLINAVVRAANGDEQAKRFVEDQCLKMQAGSDNWKKTANAIRKLVVGERNTDLLTDDLYQQNALIIRRILGMLRGEVQTPPPPSPATKPASQEREQSEGEGGVTLEQLFELVERAAKGDQEVGKQLFPAMEKMAHDPNSPPEIRKLGDVLLHILIGDLNVNVNGLPSELASAVRGLVGRVKNAK